MSDEEHEHEEGEPTELPPEQEERIVDKVVSKVRGVVEDIIGRPKERVRELLS